jgi:hypothetical protein
MRDVIRSNPPRAASVDRFERRTGQRGEWASTRLVYCAHARRRGCRGPPDDGGNQDAIKDRLTARRNAHSADCNLIAYPMSSYGNQKPLDRNDLDATRDARVCCPVQWGRPSPLITDEQLAL